MEVDIERLAAAVHEIWMEWSMSIADEISDETRLRWEKCWCEYRYLPEEEKEKDRKIARQLLKIATGGR